MGNIVKLVLFDIDDTLIKGHYPGGIGRFYYICEKYLGKKVEIDWKKFDGATTKKIIVDTFENHGMPKEKIEEKLEEIFEDAYNYFAKNLKDDYKERLIKDAETLVKKLFKEKNVYLGLLTGNEENVARLKISTVGLSDYFRFGVFGDISEDRNDLSRSVFKKAKKFLGIEFLPENIYIIGDTPNDIRCGKTIKAKTIGVATGKFTVKELKKAKADLAVKSLADKRVLNFILKA